MNDYKEKIQKYIDDHTDEMISVLKKLISYKSVKAPALENMPFGKGAADVLAAWTDICEGYGFKVKNFDNYAAHADMGGEPRLGILCHLDVVPEGTGWSSDPYTAEIRDGRIYGRGAIDDKGPAAAALFAMRCVKELGIPLDGGVRIITGCDEENGSSDMEYYRKKEKFPEMLVTPDGDYPVINGEKGMIRISFETELPGGIVSVSGGNMINAVPELCEVFLSDADDGKIKQYSGNYDGVTFETEKQGDITKLTAKGFCAHASTPEKGHNAVTAMISILCDMGYPLGALKKLFPYGETNGRSFGLEISDTVSGGLTDVFSVVKTEDGKLIGKADVRYPVTYTLKEVSEKLLAAFASQDISAEMIFSVEPHYVDENSPFIKTLLATYSDVTGNKGYCISIGGGTYVHDTENGVAFGAEFPGEENHMHGADESASLESLKLNAVIYANAIVNLLRKDK